MVVQRDTANRARLPVRGICPAQTSRIQARATALNGGQTTGWTIVTSPQATTFAGSLTVVGGWYQLDVQAISDDSTILANWTVGRVGAGEVFLVMGHSVAASEDKYAIPAATDDRATAIPLTDSLQHQRYNQTGSPNDLPSLNFTQFGEGVAPAPYGKGPYFWSRFAELVAQRTGVPVLVLNAAFGGTNLAMWWQSAQGVPFTHPFVRSAIGMPYANLKNALINYIPQTGVRAILADHGQNDFPNKDVMQLIGFYEGIIQQARTQLGFTIPVVVNRQTPFLTTDPQRHIRQVQQTVADQPGNYSGPDYDAGLQPTDRYDGIHLNASGQEKAAQLWANAISDAFLQTATPFTPDY
ncbi:hypothetical protein AWR27_01640 [Spirosoma montaniterrae]|uniref:Sialate O-acetylesterase domain-containing protein n=2 Tax=Spirosoma montaniterrae TaxID=1178516 RepID=A0A1P9WS11_9BACT|nr:hypothetical protein AWR27_01640 [Spirosoma montaniterrae]